MLKSIFSLPADLYKNRRLVMKLAKNDFKTRYAGSYFGTFWAFVQPVVTILVYWFVFSVGFRSNTDELGVPFVLYLVAGIVPWFFFSDALSGGTNSLLEYNYLVKKVVFNISVLPVVKIISALFVHGFFVLLAIILYICLFPCSGTLLCYQCNSSPFPRSEPDYWYRITGWSMVDSYYVGVREHDRCQQPSIQNSSAESCILYCIRIS